jgi:ribose-phosphate pyrophosphokinase
LLCDDPDALGGIWRQWVAYDIPSDRRTRSIRPNREVQKVGMTTLALSSAPLRRLFDRLDFAPRPRESALVAALESWSVMRKGRITPAYPLPSESLGVATLVFMEAERQRDYVLKQAGREATPLLGPIKEGAWLSGAPNRRSAVRLRRLIDLVVSKGEPLFASFSTKPFHQPPAIVDLIAAPHADPNGRICGALVASEVRHAGPVDGPLRRRREEDDMPVLCSLGGSLPIRLSPTPTKCGVQPFP